MIAVDRDLCIGCGACVRDCPSRNLFLENRKAHTYSGDCLMCGHCVSVCPSRAVAIPDYDMDDVEDCPLEGFPLNAGAFLRSVKARRSIRTYRAAPIEAEKAALLFEAGRYTATACNRQSMRYIFVQEQLPELKKLVWDYIGHALSLPSGQAPENIETYRGFYERHQKDPADDYLFRNAPAALFFACDYPVDTGLTAQNIEHMAVSLGLGALYNGYLARIVRAPQLAEWLGTDGKEVYTSMLLGYPAVGYRRTAPRLKADVVWK